MENSIHTMPVKAPRVLLSSPSGCGKTETYRALKEYFSKTIPSSNVDIIDISSITDAGYKGKDTTVILQSIYRSSSRGESILFLDEADNIASKSYPGSGETMGLMVQNQLLSLIEGCTEAFVNPATGEVFEIDTRNTMFIGCGSFNAVRMQKRKRQEKTIGFVNTTESSYDIYDELTREDMLEAGYSSEFLGRFSIVVSYHRLSEEAIRKIIRKTACEVSKSLEILIELDKNCEDSLVRMANTSFGCRLIYSKLYGMAISAYREILLENIPGVPKVIFHGEEYELVREECLTEEQEVY